MTIYYQDTLEEKYAIKFYFKIGKNATETYGMLQTAFGASCMNRASVLECHMRFKEGREFVRDDERCGKSKEVRTPELIGQIKNLMNKDRRVSIETISAQFDVNVGTVHTLIREELKMQKICMKFVPRVLRKKDIVMTAGRWSSWIYCYDPETKRQFPVEACWLSQTQEGQTEQIHPQTFDDPFF